MERYRWDNFVLDLDAYRLERGGVPLSLEPKAINLLTLLVSRPGHLFTKQEIFAAVWPDTAVSDHALTRVIAQLRRVLGDEAREAKYIETVPTRGYRWVPQVEVVVDAPPAPLAVATPVALPNLITAEAAPRRRPVVHGLALALSIAVVVLALLVAVPRQISTSASAPSAAAVIDVRWPLQVTTNPGLDLQPAIAPDGHALAYVSDKTGAFEIYVRAFDGAAAETPLTSDGSQNVQPAWSPDGRLIAYHSYRHGGIWVVPARGGVPRQVAREGSNPAWAPDGSRIAFQSDEHNDITPGAYGAQSGSVLRMVDVDGSNLRELTRVDAPMGGHAAPAWSRDGRHIGFSVFDAGPNNGAWLLTLDTGVTKPLLRGDGLFELAFAPDESALFAAGGSALIMRLPFDAKTQEVTGPAQPIPVPGVAGVRGLSISRDGTRIAFAGIGLNSQIWVQPIGRDGSPAGAARPVTTDATRRTSLPTISPDGSKVAYMSTRSGEPPNVWVIDLDGRNRIQVTSDEFADFRPQWLPDGRRLTYFSNRGGAGGLWSVDVATRREQPMLTLAELLSSKVPRGQHQAGTGPVVFPKASILAEFDLSPSVTRAAFALITAPSSRRVLFDTPLDVFTPRPLTDPSVSVGYPAWSPDERSVAVEIKDGSSTHAAIVDVETRTIRKLTNERGQTWIRSWSPDGSQLAAAILRDGVWSLRAIDVHTGKQRALTQPEPPHVYVRYPDWSRRGDMVVFERGELRGNIWVLGLQ